MTPITYLEHRIAVLKADQPRSQDGVLARDAAIAELERCVEILKRDVIARLDLELAALRQMADGVQ